LQHHLIGGAIDSILVIKRHRRAGNGGGSIAGSVATVLRVRHPTEEPTNREHRRLADAMTQPGTPLTFSPVQHLRQLLGS